MIIFYNVFIYIATLQLEKDYCSIKILKKLCISRYNKNTLFIKYEFVKNFKIWYLEGKKNNKIF